MSNDFMNKYQDMPKKYPPQSTNYLHNPINDDPRLVSAKYNE